MNNNKPPVSFLDLATRANVAANGRWGITLMLAIALHQGQPQLAFWFALVILGACCAEQLPTGRIRVGATVLVYLAAFVLVFLLSMAL